MEKIRVLLADDHPIARAGIRNFINKELEIEVIGEADNGQEALQLVLELKPDVLLLDMEMPGLKGIDVAKELKGCNSSVKILALSSYNDKQYIFGLLSNGAAGYLTKEEVPDMIIEAIRGVARGERGWLSRKAAAIITTWTTQENQTEASLSARELEVLKRVVDGKTNQEIGLAMGISPKTVEKHLESLFMKFHVSSRVEAAVYAVREGLV